MSDQMTNMPKCVGGMWGLLSKEVSWEKLQEKTTGG